MKSYSLENSVQESVFREDLSLYNCLQLERQHPGEQGAAVVAQRDEGEEREHRRVAQGVGQAAGESGAGGQRLPAAGPVRLQVGNGRVIGMTRVTS